MTGNINMYIDKTQLHNPTSTCRNEFWEDNGHSYSNLIDFCEDAQNEVDSLNSEK